ncbi:phosphoribosyltransferase family protein [Mucilaginibacter lacusdianchii]|uniref:phosphoribosyltransferase family protein n=1 Tax=Mucilaginibacter lacusdianchii TaxID=2684211 RepID=UPI00131D5D0B|nr:phosphoribosyltransferase family protein [Mucilaginibacter sp. JXJ CY 39]
MQHYTYSLHKISSNTSFGFSAADYSRFKFGDDKVSAQFGKALADGFIQDVLETKAIQQQLVVISSPYSFIPTATFAMKNYFVFQLNRWLAGNGLPVVQEAKVHRTITYKEDYGALDAEQRMSLISNDSFHIDANFLEGKVLLFLDDIKITGSHERMISKMIAEYKLQNEVHMLYFAELVNSSIHPNIENDLNYHEVKTIFDLDKIINSGQFAINTRLVKYILNYAHQDFCIFIEYQSKAFINQLYDMALGNSYHTMDNYSLNLNYIKNYLFTKNQNTLIQHGN